MKKQYGQTWNSANKSCFVLSTLILVTIFKSTSHTYKYNTWYYTSNSLRTKTSIFKQAKTTNKNSSSSTKYQISTVAQPLIGVKQRGHCSLDWTQSTHSEKWVHGMMQTPGAAHSKQTLRDVSRDRWTLFLEVITLSSPLWALSPWSGSKTELKSLSSHWNVTRYYSIIIQYLIMLYYIIQSLHYFFLVLTYVVNSDEANYGHQRIILSICIMLHIAWEIVQLKSCWKLPYLKRICIFSMNYSC